MTEETSGKQVSFCQCLIHESKKAYLPWLKVILAGVIIIGVIALTVYWRDIIINTYTQFVQLTDIVPWYVYPIGTLLLIPLVYATGICIKKRLHEDTSSNIGVIMLIFSLVTFFIGAGLLNATILSIAVLCTTFTIGIARD